MDKILIILGPTATGKTDLAIDLARKFNGEIVACDSRQVYKGLDIGSGKLPGGKDINYQKKEKYWLINRVKVWMYDVVQPKKIYTAWDYVTDAKEIIKKIKEENKLPIVVGGSGLYLKALIEGLDFIEIKKDKFLRKELEKMDLVDLQKELEKLSNQKYFNLNNSDKNNKRRLIRYIEIERGGNSTKRLEGIENNNQILKVGLTCSKKTLDQRIDERVISRMDQGMLEEAEKLKNEGLSYKRMKSLGLEYGILVDFIMGRIKTKKELVEILKIRIHQFAKRQLTWFKKEKGVDWINIEDKDYVKKVELVVSDWYNTTHG